MKASEFHFHLLRLMVLSGGDFDIVIKDDAPVADIEFVLPPFKDREEGAQPHFRITKKKED